MTNIQIDNALVGFRSIHEYLIIELGLCTVSRVMDGGDYKYQQIDAQMCEHEIINLISNPELNELRSSDGWNEPACKALALSIVENSTQGLTVTSQGNVAVSRARLISPHYSPSPDEAKGKRLS